MVDKYIRTFNRILEVNCEDRLSGLEIILSNLSIFEDYSLKITKQSAMNEIINKVSYLSLIEKTEFFLKIDLPSSTIENEKLLKETARLLGFGIEISGLLLAKKIFNDRDSVRQDIKNNLNTIFQTARSVSTSHSHSFVPEMSSTPKKNTETAPAIQTALSTPESLSFIGPLPVLQPLENETKQTSRTSSTAKNFVNSTLSTLSSISRASSDKYRYVPLTNEEVDTILKVVQSKIIETEKDLSDIKMSENNINIITKFIDNSNAFGFIYTVEEKEIVQLVKRKLSTKVVEITALSFLVAPVIKTAFQKKCGITIFTNNEKVFKFFNELPNKPQKNLTDAALRNLSNSQKLLTEMTSVKFIFVPNNFEASIYSINNLLLKQVLNDWKSMNTSEHSDNFDMKTLEIELAKNKQ
uniref:T2SSE_N domain-containing protein n=1 Tax=Strongyloides papillosus TaxID=174720 RepID=A0A0N5C4F9_STREA